MDKLTLTRIYTEGGEPHATNIKRDTANFYAGFSIYEGIGLYKGKEELSLCLEIIHANTDTDKENLLAICEGIKRHNHQEAVYLVNSAIEAELI